MQRQDNFFLRAARLKQQGVSSVSRRAQIIDEEAYLIGRRLTSVFLLITREQREVLCDPRYSGSFQLRELIAPRARIDKESISTLNQR